MKIELRLKEVLQRHGLLKHGVVADMAGETGYHRHSLTKLLNNEITNPSLVMLGAICDYLIKHGVAPEILPGALFGTRPNELWNAITALGRVTIYVGELRQAHKRWIAASDHQVENNLVEYLSRGEVATPEVLTRYIPFRLQEDRKKKSPSLKADIENAGEMFEALKTDAKRSSILIGSQRTNYLVEFLVADLVGCRPFVPTKAIVPVYLKHHETDYVAPSCFGGKAKPPGFTASKAPPGVYYRGKRGWNVCPCVDKKQEAGVVILLRDPGTQKTAIAVFGLTGWGTQATGRALLKNDFWQSRAAVTHKGREVAVFVCQSTFRDTARATRAPETVEFRLTPLDTEILAKFLA